MAYLEPLAVTKAQAMEITAMPKLVQRWCHYGWVEIVRQGKQGRKTILDYQSVVRAYELFKQGKQPPLLPSEQKLGRN